MTRALRVFPSTGVAGIGIVCLAGASWLPAQEFFDDFNREDGPVDAALDDSWLTYQGVAEIRSEELVVETPVEFNQEAWTWIDGISFSGDITVQFEVEFDTPDASPDVGRHGGIMIFATEESYRYSPAMNGYIMDWIDRTTDHGYRFHKWTAGAETPLIPDGSAPDPNPGSTWRITVSGPTLTFEADGEIKGQVDDEDYREGFIGFYAYLNGQHIHIDNVLVGTPPEAVIVADPASGPAPLEVHFDGSGSSSPEGSITDYKWDFGDGESDAGAKVTHTYKNVGLYKARLTVTDTRGVPGSASALISATFPSNDVSPWRSDDVGTPVMQGGARLDGGCLTILGGGKEIAGTEDSFHFVHQEKAGDTTLTAQANEVISMETAGRLGLMFRDTLDTGSAFALMALGQSTAGLRPVFLSRPAEGSRVTSRTLAGIVTPPSYLRLERSGAEFTGLVSADGQTWTQVHTVSLDAPAERMLCGLAVCGADRDGTGVFAQVKFCEASFGGSEPPPNPPRNLTGTAGDGKVDLAWDEPEAGATFTGYRVLRDGTAIADLPATQRTYEDGGLTNGTRYCYVVAATRGASVSAGSSEFCATPPGGGDGFHRGDPNDDGKVNITDGIHVLNFLFLGGPEPTCSESADANDDGQINITDGISILNFLFLGGLSPADPGPVESPCGPDPAGSPSVGCASYTHCEG